MSKENECGDCICKDDNNAKTANHYECKYCENRTDFLDKQNLALENALGAKRSGKKTFIDLAIENTQLKEKLKVVAEALNSEIIKEYDKTLGNEILSRFVLTAMLRNTLNIVQQALKEIGELK